MSLEGRLRDLALAELCQLLGASRKSGVLHVTVPLQARAATIRFDQGVVVDAMQWPLDGTNPNGGTRLPASANSALANSVHDATRAVESCVLELLTWQDGEFRFVAQRGDERGDGGVRLAVDTLLVEAAQREETWHRLRARVPGAGSVPAFVHIEPRELPLLRLIPQEWEVLTRVDGRRDVGALATTLGRSILDVAQIVHDLIGAGVLALRDDGAPPRQHPTPPAHKAVDDWGTTGDAAAGIDDLDFESDAFAFDPPHLPEFASEAAAEPDHARTLEIPPSASHGTEAAWPSAGMDAASLCARGDESALRGDLAAALTFWSAALRDDATPVDADRIREAIALAARLHALLHPMRRVP